MVLFLFFPWEFPADFFPEANSLNDDCFFSKRFTWPCASSKICIAIPGGLKCPTNWTWAWLHPARGAASRRAGSANPWGCWTAMQILTAEDGNPICQPKNRWSIGYVVNVVTWTTEDAPKAWNKRTWHPFSVAPVAASWDTNQTMGFRGNKAGLGGSHPFLSHFFHHDDCTITKYCRSINSVGNSIPHMFWFHRNSTSIEKDHSFHPFFGREFHSCFRTPFLFLVTAF